MSPTTAVDEEEEETSREDEYGMTSTTMPSVDGIMQPQQQEQATVPSSSATTLNVYFHRKVAGLASVAFYIFAWVANAEFMQLTVNNIHRSPGFLTWYSYCFMILSVIPLQLYVGSHQCCCCYSSHKSSATTSVTSVWEYLVHVWAGRLGIRRAVGYALIMTYLMIFVNITWIVGLGSISVATSNAVYQLQAAITILLSLWFLRPESSQSTDGEGTTTTETSRSLVAAEVVGMTASLFGVLLIVLPPLWRSESDDNDEEDDDGGDGLSSLRKSPVVGILATLGSAVFWALYQVSWEVLSEAKKTEPLMLPNSGGGSIELQETSGHEDAMIAEPRQGRQVEGATESSSSALDGLMDTFATLFVMGCCNLLLGWPLLLVLHWTGLESFVFPTTTRVWSLVTVNGLIEYTFDASCAIAIYMTSAMMTAVTAPLTIPLSFLWDEWWYPPQEDSDEGDSVGSLGWFGAFVIMVGVVLMEMKPPMPLPAKVCLQRWFRTISGRNVVGVGEHDTNGSSRRALLSEDQQVISS